MDRLAPPSGDRDPRQRYADRADRFDEAAERADRTVRTHGRLRLATFAGAVAGTWLLLSGGLVEAAWGVVGGAALLFAALVVVQRRAKRRRRRAALMAEANREGIARVGRRWDELPLLYHEAPPRDHAYADDLDLVGRASLLHLTSTVSTGPGRRTLRTWLFSGTDPRTAEFRQEAVAELAGALDFRDRLTAEARMIAEAKPTARARPTAGDKLTTKAKLTDGPVPARDLGSRRFLLWAEGEPWLPSQRWLLAAAFVLPPINVTALILWLLGAVPSPVVAWPVLASLAILGASWKRVSQVFSNADDESSARQYGPLLAHISGGGLAAQSHCLVRIQERLGGGPSGRPAHREIRRLRRLLDMADLRRSPLFHLPLALVFFWDVHVLAALERWQVRSGSRVRDWLCAMGEAEALSALAALAADHPDWTMPTFDDRAQTVRARALGHPLLPPDSCVRNDVEVGPPGSFLLVTGSNMSGKSTLLKAIGLNVVLAQAGAPVCARALRLPSLRVATSMSVRDSLADGVSFFMAELRRLKQVVDAAESHDASTRTLYLLDELLQGTNSAERRVAARTVIRRLLASGAVGAVTTHDLTLADAEDLNARAVAVHFTETVRASGRDNNQDDDADQLAFDYRLRPGTATSTNALRLLGLVGLDQLPPAGKPPPSGATDPSASG